MVVLLFETATQLKQELDTYRPFPQDVLKNLRETIRVEWTYHSNAIEGNTLSLVETKIVLEEGLTIGGKKLLEHFEVINHGEAIDYIEEQLQKNQLLTQQFIKNVHYLILNNINNQNAGVYRSRNVFISGSQHTPPSALQVQEHMDQLMYWYESNKDSLHPIELAALFHFKFVYIHPFIDGNGRTARLLMNFILMQHGYPPAIVKADQEKRIQYIQSLEKASTTNDTNDFVQLIARCSEESLEKYLYIVRTI